MTTQETDYLSLNYNLKLEKANTVGGIIFLYIHTHTHQTLSVVIKSEHSSH